MSISLNNHESRIKSLESKSFGGYRALYPNGIQTIDVSDLIKQGYNVFIPMSNPYLDAATFINTPILVPEINTEYRAHHHYEYNNTHGYGYYQLANNVISVRTSGYASDVSGILIKVLIALKLYYNFSYNIYCLIYTFLEFLFKEV